MDENFTLILANDHKLNLSYREMLLLLKHRYTLLCILSSFAAIFSFNPYEELSSLPKLYFLLVLMSIVAITLAIYMTFILANIKFLVLYKAASRSVYSTLSMGLASSITAGIMWSLTETLTGEAMTYTKMVLFACFNIVVAEFILTTYVSYFGKQVLLEIRTKQDLNHGVGDQRNNGIDAFASNSIFIGFGSNKVLMRDILLVKSDDAYIDIILSNGKNIYVRGRIGDVIERLGDLGFSPHRSFWISNSAIKEVVSNGHGYKKIILKNTDIEVPVAKAREALVNKIISEI